MLQAARGKEVRVQASVGATAAHYGRGGLAQAIEGGLRAAGVDRPSIEAGTEGPPLFPWPWAADPSLSYLRPPQEVRGLVEAAGFRAME